MMGQLLINKSNRCTKSQESIYVNNIGVLHYVYADELEVECPVGQESSFAAGEIPVWQE